MKKLFLPLIMLGAITLASCGETPNPTTKSTITGESGVTTAVKTNMTDKEIALEWMNSIIEAAEDHPYNGAIMDYVKIDRTTPSGSTEIFEQKDEKRIDFTLENGLWATENAGNYAEEVLIIINLNVQNYVHDFEQYISSAKTIKFESIGDLYKLTYGNTNGVNESAEVSLAWDSYGLLKEYRKMHSLYKSKDVLAVESIYTATIEYLRVEENDDPTTGNEHFDEEPVRITAEEYIDGNSNLPKHEFTKAVGVIELETWYQKDSGVEYVESNYTYGFVFVNNRWESVEKEEYAETAALILNMTDVKDIVSSLNPENDAIELYRYKNHYIFKNNKYQSGENFYSTVTIETNEYGLLEEYILNEFNLDGTNKHNTIGHFRYSK